MILMLRTIWRMRLVHERLPLCLRLLAPGESQVWMEDPGYPGARQLMEVSGVRRVDVPVDQAGLRVDEGVRLAQDL